MTQVASDRTAVKVRLAWIWDLSERRVLEPVDEQCLLAEDFDTRIGGRQPAGQDKQQAGCRPADRDVGFAVAVLDGDAGRDVDLAPEMAADGVDV
jgi:hypothetical protein